MYRPFVIHVLKVRSQDTHRRILPLRIPQLCEPGVRDIAACEQPGDSRHSWLQIPGLGAVGSRGIDVR